MSNNITLIIPTVEEAKVELSELLNILYDAFDTEAFPKAKTFFEKNNKEIDAFLINDLIRFYVKQYLLDCGIFAEDDVDSLANNGIALKHKGYRIRVLKADHSYLPFPGESKTKKGFFNQQLSFYQMSNANEDEWGNRFARPNLLILWEPNNPSYNYVTLYISCPQKCGEYPSSMDTYFFDTVEHPATTIQTKMFTYIEDELGIDKKPDSLIGEHQDDDNDLYNLRGES